ncbi:MAG TPA: GDSL-type esterase/lipase family protein [Pedobacter sp.]|jgi:lysophospholipase L1-like esterase
MIWYEEEVKHLEKQAGNMKYRPVTAFYGSSSIRLWNNLYEDFKYYKPVNLGFGGSTLAACVWFFDRIFLSYNPDTIIIYAGDNDLGDGRHPEEVFIFFQQLVLKIKEKYGDIDCYFLSIKPSLSRWNLIESFKFTNYLIENEINKNHKNWTFVNLFNKMLDKNGYPKKEYFESDDLHLSKEGYELWKQILLAKLSSHI